MQVNIIMQKENENTIASAISNCLENNAKKAYFFIGNFKETGYKIIEEDLIDIKTKLSFVIGVDKKTTTKSMLEGLLKYTDDVYYYSNNGLSEFVSNICIFEYTDKATMIISASNISESGILTDLTAYTMVTYNLKDSEDKAEYKKHIKELQKIVEMDGFNKLTKEAITMLAETKEIFTTRQYNHSVMSISELLGKKAKTEEKKDETAVEEPKKEVEIPKIDLSDISIDIDLPEEEINSPIDEDINIDYEEENVSLPDDIESYEEIDEEDEVEEEDKISKDNELYDESLAEDNIDLNKTLDINSMLFSKADVKLDISDSKDKKKNSKVKKTKVLEDEEDKIVKSKKVNLNNISTLMFEVSAKNSKSSDTVTVPNYVKTIIPEFFGLDEAENEEISGSVYKVKHITLDIIDAKENRKEKDDKALMTYKPRQSFISFISEKLANVEYSEDDIIRIIKISDEEYQMEIISKDMQEYKVWSKLCNQTMRNSTKKMGMM